MRPLTKTEFAKERGISRARVYQWIEDGRVQVLEDGRIDADEAHARLDASLDQSKGMRPGGNITSSSPAEPVAGNQAELTQAPQQRPLEPATSAQPNSAAQGDYWADRAREQKAVATMAELKALQQAGALVAAAGVKREGSETARGLRNALQSIPDRSAPVLASMTSPAQIHKHLLGEINRVLDEFCARLEQRAADAAGAEQPDRALV